MHMPRESSLRESLLERKRAMLVEGARSGSRHRTVLLGEVDDALKRIEGGSFGICEVCDGRVEEDRLAADPLVRVCLDCLSREEREALEQDLELAARIQQRMLPGKTLRADGWEAHYHYEPLGVVSGDLCDLIPPEKPGGELHFLFADVSGKGVAASILTAHLQATFRSLAGLGLPMPEIMDRANRLFSASTTASSYATAVFGKLAADGELELCNAGHYPPLLSRNGRLRRIDAHGLPLGLFSSGRYTCQRFGLRAGDILFLYTDGLTDTGNGGDESYDPARVATVLENGGTATAEQTVHAFLTDLARFRNGAPRSDDLTLLAIRRQG